MAANGAGKKVATEFEKIINEGRDRKKNEALAARIFSRDRRSSTPLRSAPAAAGPLAARAGIKKQQQRAVSSSAAPRHSAGNIDGEWTHDLHDSRGPRAANPRPGSLAARISNPNLGPAGNPRHQRRAAQVAQALIRTELQPARAPAPAPARSVVNSPVAAIPKAAQLNSGLTIRGLAGPFVVLAQNFAPGTTAADIETVMTPVGGIVERCRIIKTHPFIIAEIVFESKEGAEKVIAAFNGQTADGRILNVFAKPGNTIHPDNLPSHQQPPSGPRAMRDETVIDGSLGFDDPMETEDAVYSNGNSNGTSNGNGRQPPRGPAASNTGGLYSDTMVPANRRGRGFGGRQRWGGS